MQPYSYIPGPNGTMVPVRYMPPPPNYQPVYPVNYAPQPMHYQPVYPTPNVPMMPYVIPSQYPPVQQYYYPNMSHLRPSRLPQKKDDKLGATSDSKQNKGLQGLVGANSDVNELLKQKGTKIKLSKIYRITKKKHNPQDDDDDTSDDEYEQLPIDSARTSSLQPSALPYPRIPSATSSCSHCSTCSNCSCSDCRIQNGGHLYDDCPECRAQARHHHTQESSHHKYK